MSRQDRPAPRISSFKTVIPETDYLTLAEQIKNNPAMQKKIQDMMPKGRK